jgi:hypothetical protein
VVKLELLSQNIVLIMNQLIGNKEIVKYLYYNVNNPLTQADISLPAKSLMFKNVFPYPFDKNATITDCSQIRAYYPIGYLKNNEIINDTNVVFDIIVAKSLWLVNDGESKIRPYELLRHTISTFSGKSIGTLGQLHFSRFMHLTVNDKFDAIRLEATMTTIGTG